jgi:hypothetical protein
MLPLTRGGFLKLDIQLGEAKTSLLVGSPIDVLSPIDAEQLKELKELHLLLKLQVLDSDELLSEDDEDKIY